MWTPFFCFGFFYIIDHKINVIVTNGNFCNEIYVKYSPLHNSLINITDPPCIVENVVGWHECTDFVFLSIRIISSACLNNQLYSLLWCKFSKIIFLNQKNCTRFWYLVTLTLFVFTYFTRERFITETVTSLWSAPIGHVTSWGVRHVTSGCWRLTNVSGTCHVITCSSGETLHMKTAPNVCVFV